MFNLLNKIRFLKVKKCVLAIKSISDIARDFGEKFLHNFLHKLIQSQKRLREKKEHQASRSYNMRMFNHAVIITNDSISYFANFLYCWETEIKIILKMMPPEFTLKYDEKFTSESNADIL
ncbi:unnamed protein product [Rhizophagus irregularis]|nr:unnamed protein product [Rhizophagus irregularis]